MLKYYLYIRNWFESEEGQDLIEYALLVALISIIAVLSITSAGGSVSSLFATVATKLSTAVGE